MGCQMLDERHDSDPGDTEDGISLLESMPGIHLCLMWNLKVCERLILCLG